MSRNYVLNDLEFDNIPLKIMLPIREQVLIKYWRSGMNLESRN